MARPVVALAVLLLAGCGGAESNEAGTATATGSQPTDSSTAADQAGPTGSDEPTDPNPETTAPGAGSPDSAPDSDTDAPEPTSTFGDDVTGTPAPDGRSDVTTDLDVPWDMAFLPDGSALVTLRDEARVVRVDEDGSQQQVEADGEGGRVAGVAPGGEGGLLGITTDASAEHVFVYFTAADDNRVIRYAWDEAQNTLSEPTPILTGIPRFDTHNGGRIDLGPDGLLYVATGDAQDRDAPPDPDSLAGKILRVSTDGEPAADNPDPDSPVFSLGHRNVQGMGWSPDGTMWASEFGQNETDELNIITAGADYGWPRVEGTGGGEGLTDPVVTWSPAEASPSGIAVTADAVYVAGLRGARLWRVPVDAGEVAGEPEPYLQGELGRLRHVEVAPDGSLWLLTNNTSRGEPNDGDDRIVRLPLQ